LPGKARRATVHDEIVIPADALPLAGSHGPPTGLLPAKFPGVVDDKQAKLIGKWHKGSGLKPYFGYGYLYASAPATATFTLEAPQAGKYDIRIAYQPHQNRGNTVPVMVKIGDRKQVFSINMRKPAPLEHGFFSLGSYLMAKGENAKVTISSKGANGNAHVDAAQLVPVR
ncbi:MAG: hypothetical protein VCA36_10575, partial [Opitutales bacterium]